MRKATLFVLLTLIAGVLHAARSPLLGDLELGQHAVGFKVLDRYDTSRPFRYPYDLEGKPRTGPTSRPIQISVWYPAKSSTRAPMRLRDYVALMGRETAFDREPADEQRRGDAAYFAFEVLRPASPEQRKQLLDLETAAVRDAEPAAGKFPLIVWSLGSPAVYQASAEYLASHGYAVAIVPRLPETQSFIDTSPTRVDYESKARDIAFLLAEVERLPYVDTSRIGVTGFSAGGRWAAAEAMRNPLVRAVVSHDSILFFNDDGNTQFLQMPFVDPSRMRAPVLHMIRRDWVPREGSTLWKDMQYSERTAWTFEDRDLDHLDFASIGYASTLIGLRAEHKQEIAETFHLFNRATLRFFDKHVRGESDVAGVSLPAGFVSVAHLAAAATFLAEGQFQEAILEHMDKAIDVYRKWWAKTNTPPLPEGTLNLAGYQLLAVGRVDDAIRVFSLNAEVFPNSANVYDSLSDAYLAAGNREKAIELAKKTLALLETDKTLNEQRRAGIEQSAKAKLAQREGAR